MKLTLLKNVLLEENGQLPMENQDKKHQKSKDSSPMLELAEREFKKY